MAKFSDVPAACKWCLGASNLCSAMRMIMVFPLPSSGH